MYILHVYTLGVTAMATAKVFKSGNSQAVRLPKEFRFEGEEVDIFRRGDEVVMREKSKGLERAFEILANLAIDVDAIEQARKEPPKKRKGL
jgi:antitoxin VapB